MTHTIQVANLNEMHSSTPRLWSFLDAGIVQRALVVTLVLGSILALANQSEEILGPEKLQVIPLFLLYATPFAVVITAQLLGTRRATLDIQGNTRTKISHEPLWLTALRHGIPSKAFYLGLLFSSLNTSIALASALVKKGF